MISESLRNQRTYFFDKLNLQIVSGDDPAAALLETVCSYARVFYPVESAADAQSPPRSLLSDSEQAVIDALADAWNKFIELPELHQSSRVEFAHTIHLAQNMVLARPTLRSLQGATL